MVVLLCQPSQDFSAVTVVRCSVTALASSSLRSKSPPIHPLFGQSMRNTDLALSRLGRNLICVFLVTPAELKKPMSTASDFNCGNVSDKLGDSFTRWPSCSRYSKRGPPLTGYVIAAHPSIGWTTRQAYHELGALSVIIARRWDHVQSRPQATRESPGRTVDQVSSSTATGTSRRD